MKCCKTDNKTVRKPCTSFGDETAPDVTTDHRLVEKYAGWRMNVKLPCYMLIKLKINNFIFSRLN